MINVFARHSNNWVLELVTILVAVLLLPSQTNPVAIHASRASPVLNDPDLKVENVVSGIEFPTGMAFLGQNDILVIEKDTGKVKRVIDGELLNESLLDVNVANDVERGLLGIAVSKNLPDNKTYVFLLYTESEGKNDGGDPVGNRLYRYELVDNKLINPKLLLDLPYLPGPAHNGGVVVIGPDNIVYVIVGNLYSPAFNEGGENNLIQNIRDGNEPDGRGGIIHVNQDGQLVGNGILGDEHPLDMYYAYGIRNSFGLDFDPLTGNLWDTENGPDYGDEINLVEPGFNSGWREIQGMMNDPQDINLLEDFGGRGKYSDPELTWEKNIGPTALKFLNSDKYGAEYKNDMFLGDVNDGKIYHFDLNQNRTQLFLDGQVEDKVAGTSDEIPEKMVFGQGFGTITDIELGPDGYMYILTHDKSDGAVYRIIPEYNDNKNGASQELEESEDIGTDNDEATIDDNKDDDGEA
jgi:aldose sugar dehydrogenase